MIVEEAGLEDALKEEWEKSELGRRQVVNAFGITVMRWCQSCAHHKVDGRRVGRVKCCMTDEWKDGRYVCAMWQIARCLDRVGDPSRQQMWKPKAYFDWLLRAGVEAGDNRYAWWKDNVMAEGEEQS